MKVSIKPGNKKQGLIFRSDVHTVTVNTQFSEEEKAVVKELKLKGYVVIEDAPFAKNLHLDVTVGEFMSGQDYVFTLQNSTDAQDFVELVKASLGNLKAHMETYSEGPSEEAFEL